MSDAFTGPVNSRKKKSELQDIASALSLQDTRTVKDLVSSIQQHLTAHPELSDQPRFQGLFSYRPDSIPAKNKLKSSAIKAAEDASEEAKVGKVPTGAHKMLLDMEVTVDPPAQFTPLLPANNRANTLCAEPEGNESEESGDDGHHDQITSAAADIDAEIAPNSPVLGRLDQEEATKGRILVTFQSSDSATHSHEAWIDPQSDSEDAPFVYGRMGENGEPEYYARISEFLPYALENASPIKASKGRILRPGRDSASARIHLGSIEDLSKFTAPQSKALKMPMVDTIPLDTSSGDYFKCTLFLDLMEPKIPTQTYSTSSPVKASRKHASGSTTKKPSSQDNESFIKFLRDLLEVGDDVPGRADKVGIALTRHLKLEAAYEKLTEMQWHRTRGGFKVPEGHSQFPGREFSKEQVQTAFRTIPSKANSDAQRFNPAKLQNAPKVLAWISNPKGKYADRFSRMSPADFTRYVEEKDEKASRTFDHQEGSSKRKRSGDDSNCGHHKSKKSKEKGKSRAVDSEDLDD